jgi:hypothetical protein
VVAPHGRPDGYVPSLLDIRMTANDLGGLSKGPAADVGADSGTPTDVLDLRPALICSWCQTTIRPGARPASQRDVPACFDRQMTTHTHPPATPSRTSRYPRASRDVQHVTNTAS